VHPAQRTVNDHATSFLRSTLHWSRSLEPRSPDTPYSRNSTVYRNNVIIYHRAICYNTTAIITQVGHG